MSPYRKLYVTVSVTLCLLVSSLVLFFLFPRSVILSPVAVESVYVYFTPTTVQMNITVRPHWTYSFIYHTAQIETDYAIKLLASCLFLCITGVFLEMNVIIALVSLPSQNILNITNDNFFTVQAYNLTVQALFDKTVVGKADMKNVTTVKPLTDKTVSTSPHYQLLYCIDVSFCKPLNIVT